MYISFAFILKIAFKLQVTCDLIEICRQSLSQDVNLVREVEKICRICPSNDEQIDSKEKPLDSQKEKMKRPFGT